MEYQLVNEQHWRYWHFAKINDCTTIPWVAIDQMADWWPVVDVVQQGKYLMCAKCTDRRRWPREVANNQYKMTRKAKEIDNVCVCYKRGIEFHRSDGNVVRSLAHKFIVRHFIFRCAWKEISVNKSKTKLTSVISHSQRFSRTGYWSLFASKTMALPMFVVEDIPPPMEEVISVHWQ